MTLSIVRVSLYLFVLMFLAFTKFSSILSLLLACLFCSSHQHFCVTITGFRYDEFIVHLTSKWSHTSLNSESEGELNQRESTDLPLRSPSYPSSCLQEITASQYRFCTTFYTFRWISQSFPSYIFLSTCVFLSSSSILLISSIVISALTLSAMAKMFSGIIFCYFLPF